MLLRRLKAHRHSLHWQGFRDFFSIAILKYFVVWFSIVPIVAYLFRGIPDEIPIALGSHNVAVLKFGLPFNWLILWLASVAYTAALALYRMFCPREIQKYHNFGEYLNERHSPRWISWMAHKAIELGGTDIKLVQRLEIKQYLKPSNEKLPAGVISSVLVLPDCSKLVVRRNTAFVEFSMPVVDAGRLNKDETARIEEDVFWEIFGYYAGSRLAIRVTILILLSIALLLFVYVLLQHVWSIEPYIIQEVQRWLSLHAG